MFGCDIFLADTVPSMYDSHTVKTAAAGSIIARIDLTTRVCRLYIEPNILALCKFCCSGNSSVVCSKFRFVHFVRKNKCSGYH
jgi:hypothetical protein